MLVAGATGAIGAPLVRALLSRGHEVIGLTRNVDRARRLPSGCASVIADALDRDGLLQACDGLAVDAVINQLTDLRKAPTRHRDLRSTNALRITGTRNLLDAALLLGVRRFVTQSMILGYRSARRRSGLLEEIDEFALPENGPFGDHLAALRATEQQALNADGIDGIALRYGLFYGHDAGFTALVDRVRQGRLKLPRGGGQLASWIYIDDAVTATAAALEDGMPGQVYNIVDDLPVTWHDYFEVLASALGTRPPGTAPGLVFKLVPYLNGLMNTYLAVSNAKARAELKWIPSANTYHEGIQRIMS